MLELKEGERHPITMTLDGQEVRGLTEPRMLLSDFLRQELGRPKYTSACEHGVCGVCTVLIDGNSARSCLTFAVQVAADALIPYGAFADKDGKLNDLQSAFRSIMGCSAAIARPAFCSPSEAFLSDNAKPSEQEVREMLSGHICRCTGYVGMVDAILETAREAAR